MLKEKDIIHENKNFWVLKKDSAYTVMIIKGTYSESVQSFKDDKDGKSCAISYCNFLAERKNK